MLTALAAISAALAALLFVLLAAILLRLRDEARGRRTAQALEAPATERATLASSPVPHAERERAPEPRLLLTSLPPSRSPRPLGVEPPGAFDLVDVLEETLEAARALPGADASLITLERRGATPVVATLGLSAQEADRHALAGVPAAGSGSHVSIILRYPGSRQAQPDGELVRAGVGVPVAGGEGQIGLLAIFTRASDTSFDDGDVQALERLAGGAAPMIEAALRLEEARESSPVDAETGLPNERSCRRLLERELARASRYGRPLTVLMLEPEGWEAVVSQLGREPAGRLLAEAARRIEGVVRAPDVACRLGRGGFAVVLPEARRADAELLRRRIEGTFAALMEASGRELRLAAGTAEPLPGDDAEALLARARAALEEERKNR
ncbi:MAG: diguanylate cyclase [Actinobacteria bacterium]|nr:diguanylate cyclase [Actinomycetota bacterium]